MCILALSFYFLPEGLIAFYFKSIASRTELIIWVTKVMLFFWSASWRTIRFSLMITDSHRFYPRKSAINPCKSSFIKEPRSTTNRPQGYWGLALLIFGIALCLDEGEVRADSLQMFFCGFFSLQCGFEEVGQWNSLLPFYHSLSILSTYSKSASKIYMT